MVQKISFPYGPTKADYVHAQIEMMLPALYRLAFALVGKSDDAEDLVHDTCVRALSTDSRANLRTEGSLKAWLRTILINIFKDHYRRQQISPIQDQRQFTLGNNSNVIELAKGHLPSPEESMIYDDLEKATIDAITNLPEDVRIIVTLYMVDENSYKDISDITGCPMGTVMSRLSRGRNLLREKLKSHFKNHEQTRLSLNQ